MAMRNFVIQAAVTILVLGAGFLLNLIGAPLLGIALMLGAIGVLVGILILDFIHKRGPFEHSVGWSASTATQSPPKPRSPKIVVKSAAAVPPEINRTPEDLWALFAGLTDLQAAKVIEPFIGKRMTVSGPLRNVGEWMGTFSQASLDRADPHTVYLHFWDKSWLDHLSVLKRGDAITARGVIARIERIGMLLTDCELLDGAPIPHSPKAPSPPETAVKLPTIASADPKLLTRVRCRLSPKELMNLCLQGATELIAQSLVEPYLGQWLSVSGTVVGVKPQNEMIISVSCLDPEKVDVVFFFDPKKWGVQLLRLMPGDQIRARGEILSVNKLQVILNRCELE